MSKCQKLKEKILSWRSFFYKKPPPGFFLVELVLALVLFMLSFHAIAFLQGRLALAQKKAGRRHKIFMQVGSAFEGEKGGKAGLHQDITQEIKSELFTFISCENREHRFQVSSPVRYVVSKSPRTKVVGGVL